jgi:hypothetical protein
MPKGEREMDEYLVVLTRWNMELLDYVVDMLTSTLSGAASREKDIRNATYRDGRTDKKRKDECYSPHVSQACKSATRTACIHAQMT